MSVAPLNRGDVVMHSVFGRGKVISTTDTLVRVEFEEVGLKQLMIALANLEVVLRSETYDLPLDEPVDEPMAEAVVSSYEQLTKAEIEVLKQKMKVEEEWLRENARGKNRFNNPYWRKRDNCIGDDE